MELTPEDFDAKAKQIQIEINSQLTRLCIERGNKHLPVKTVNDVFHKAIKHYLNWAYLEGVGVHVTKLTKGSEDKER